MNEPKFGKVPEGIPAEELQKVKRIYAALNWIHQRVKNPDAQICLQEEIDEFRTRLLKDYAEEAPKSAFVVVLGGSNPDPAYALMRGLTWKDFTGEDSVVKFVENLEKKYLKI